MVEVIVMALVICSVKNIDRIKVRATALLERVIR